MVYDYKRSFVLTLDHNVFICPGFSLPYAEQMVSRAPRNLQRCHLLISWAVQNYLLDIQCYSLRGSANNWLKGRIHVIQI